MTVGQIGSYIKAQDSARRDAFRENAVLLSGQAQQIASGVARLFNRQARFLELKRLYPKLFQEQPDTSGMKPEEIARTQAFVWENFLGV